MDLSNLNIPSLLRELDKERNKFKQDESYMKSIVERLVEYGVYPSYGIGKYSAFQMVLYYGVEWHQFSEPHFCPNCHMDLRDWDNGPPFKKEIYNGGKYFCPKCLNEVFVRFYNSGWRNET